MGELSKPALARLAFWSANMTILRDSGYKWWPGFTYTEAEWQQMDKLAAPIGGWDYQKFIWLNALIFIVFAGIAVVCYMLPVLLILYPDTRDVQPLPFSFLLASTTLIAIGVGLPISMRISAWFCASEKIRKNLASTPENEALSARVSWQLLRMTLIMCGILIPGMLLWIASNIDGGPVLTALKFILAALFIGSTVTAALRRKSS
jgi:hypothetical protein